MLVLPSTICEANTPGAYVVAAMTGRAGAVEPLASRICPWERSTTISLACETTWRALRPKYESTVPSEAVSISEASPPPSARNASSSMGRPFSMEAVASSEARSCRQGVPETSDTSGPPASTASAKRSTVSPMRAQPSAISPR